MRDDEGKTRKVTLKLDEKKVQAYQDEAANKGSDLSKVIKSRIDGGEKFKELRATKIGELTRAAKFYGVEAGDIFDVEGLKLQAQLDVLNEVYEDIAAERKAKVVKDEIWAARMDVKERLKKTGDLNGRN
jgi:LmbE family N-acetylglucosaminyl deacetylase